MTLRECMDAEDGGSPDTARLDLIERMRRYPFPNVGGKWSFRIGPDGKGGRWVHDATLRDCLDAALAELKP